MEDIILLVHFSRFSWLGYVHGIGYNAVLFLDMRFVLHKLSAIGNQKLYNVSSKTLQLYTPQSMCLPSPILTAFFIFFQVLAFFRLLPGLPSGHFPTPLKSCVIFLFLPSELQVQPVLFISISPLAA
jgi:hypothetical protein